MNGHDLRHSINFVVLILTSGKTVDQNLRTSISFLPNGHGDRWFDDCDF